jgi:Na+/pantothenate symporter
MHSILFAEAAPKGQVGTLVALILFIVVSGFIGVLANRATRDGSFMKGFFLGNRGLGAWALALTATVQSGGTFMGFPSLVYTHGWIVSLWIGSYMVVPITGFAMIGKRLAQLSRRLGAITIPDFFRERFGSSTLGLVASLAILFYMSFMMIAQFKAGAIVMKLSWPGSGSLALSEDFSKLELKTEHVARLEKAGLPEPTLAKLAKLQGQQFGAKDQLVDKLKEVLTEQELKDYKGKILSAASPIDWLYFAGLVIFTLTVVGYTMAGGFLAAVWTDLFQSVMMIIGVMLLLVLSLYHLGDHKITPTRVSVPGAGSDVLVAKMKAETEESTSSLEATPFQPIRNLQKASIQAVQNTGPGYIYGPGYDPTNKGRMFLPLSLAISFFVLWIYAGVSSPAGMVRIMACDSTQTLRRSIFLLSIYNCFIYIPLIIIVICGQTFYPNLGTESDEIVPRMALRMTSGLTFSSFWAGLILAAPFGAIMATVSSYLVVISSGLVRDVYQRFINPRATEHQLRMMSYGAMILVGIIAVASNIKPVNYLQALVVFSSTGTACTFLIPALMSAYWRRASVPGVLAAMITGAGTALTLYLMGFDPSIPKMFGFPVNGEIGQATDFRPYYLLGLDPIVWGLGISMVAGIGVSLLTKPPSPELISKLFDAQPVPAKNPA